MSSLAVGAEDAAGRHTEFGKMGSRHRRGAGFTLSGHTKNIMRHEP
jgi:hypothetical protein